MTRKEVVAGMKGPGGKGRYISSLCLCLYSILNKGRREGRLLRGPRIIMRKRKLKKEGGTLNPTLNGPGIDIKRLGRS